MRKLAGFGKVGRPSNASRLAKELTEKISAKEEAEFIKRKKQREDRILVKDPSREFRPRRSPVELRKIEEKINEIFERTGIKHYECVICREILPENCFWKLPKIRPVGHMKCKLCAKEWVVKNNYNTKSYQKNSDRLKVYQRNVHCKKNGIKGNFTLEEWLALKESYSNRCAYCGLESLSLEIEHFWPVSLANKGMDISEFATNSIENIIPACTFCNHAKDDKPFIIFLGWKNNRLQ